MKSLYKGILLGALQCALVLSLAGKLIYDRATCPHVWVRTMPYDPMLPIRGRYLSLVLAPDSGAPYFERTNRERVVYFVTESATEVDSRRFAPHADELWVEVTIPRKGPPRPIRLGWKRNGSIQPIDLN